MVNTTIGNDLFRIFSFMEKAYGGYSHVVHVFDHKMVAHYLDKLIMLPPCGQRQELI